MRSDSKPVTGSSCLDRLVALDADYNRNHIMIRYMFLFSLGNVGKLFVALPLIELYANARTYVYTAAHIWKYTARSWSTMYKFRFRFSFRFSLLQLQIIVIQTIPG